MVFKHGVGRAFYVSAAFSILMSAGWAGTAYGASGGMDRVPLIIGSVMDKPCIMSASAESGDEVAAHSLTAYKDRFADARREFSATGRLRDNIISDARKYLGTPYVFGAKYGQTKAFDCSSFVKTVFAQNGIELPRVSRNQALEGEYISRSNLQAGDLVFFTDKVSDDRIGHVGIYAGGGMMIHTYGDGGVKYSTIESGWWDSRYVTSRRFIQE